MDLSKKELEEEMQAIDESIKAHEQQMDFHEKVLKREKFLKELVNRELAKK